MYSLDSPDRYVDLLSALCFNAQVIGRSPTSISMTKHHVITETSTDDHLTNLSGACTASYQSLPLQSYEQINVKITRMAEFFAVVVIPFVLDDFKQFFVSWRLFISFDLSFIYMYNAKSR